MAILAVDAVGYSRLMAADEAGTHARLKALRKEFLDPAIARHRGRVVKLIGDGALVEFGSVVEAVLCAAAIQRAVAERNAGVPPDRGIVFRIGVNLGDIILDGDDIYGDGVNVAARLEAMAEPGEIYVSRTVHDHVKDKVDLSFEPLGERRIKNIAESVTVYRVLLDADPGTIPTAAIRRTARRAFRRWAVASAAAAVVLILAGGAILTLQRWDPAPEDVAFADAIEPWDLPAQPSIAVLPFANLSDDPEQEYFVDGITSDITTDLSKFSDLFVIAANSSFRYKDQPVEVQHAARDLGVRYVLEGSVQSIDRMLRINVNLIDAATGRYVWAERYERPADNLFAVQKEITQTVVGVVGSGWGELQRAELERIARIPTEDFQAYDLYLRGVGYNRQKNKENNASARRMFEAALDADPNYARAMAECSLTYLNDIFNGWTNKREEWLKKAEDLAQRAIEADSSEPWGLVTLGLVYQLKGQKDLALSLFEKAHALNPNDYYIKEALGYVLTYNGSAERGVELLEQAQRLNPYQTHDRSSSIVLAYFFSHQYQDALERLNRGTRGHGSPTYWLYKAATHAQLDQIDKAYAAIAEALKLNPGLTVEGESKRRRELGLAPAYAELLDEALRKAGLPEEMPAEGI